MAFLLLLNFSPNIWGFSPVAEFSVQFAQVLLDPAINVHKIREKGDLFILEGISQKKIAIYHLAEDILKSRKLRNLELYDAVPIFKEKGFTLFLRSKKLKKSPVHVSITSPQIREVVNGPIQIEGTCSLSGKDILLSGDIQGVVRCRKNKWMLKKSGFKGERKLLFVKALMVGEQGDHRIAVRSFRIP